MQEQMQRNPQSQQKLSITTTNNPHSNHKKQHKFPDSNKKITNELHQQIMTQYRKNIKKYQLILEQMPTFSHEIYVPKLIDGAHHKIHSQLDKVIYDAEKLDMEMNKIQFEKQQKKEIMDSINTDNIFEFLRTSWAKSIHADNAEQKLEQINRKIGSIKGQIKKVVEKQNIQGSNSTFEDIVKNSKYYLALQSQNNSLRKQNQEYESKFAEHKQTIKNSNKEIHKLKWDLHLEKQKVIRYMDEINKFKSASQVNISTKEDICSLQQIMKVDNVGITNSNSEDNLNDQRNEIKVGKILYWHQSHKFVVKIQSDLLATSEKIETKRTLHEIQKFLGASNFSSHLTSSVDLSGIIQNGNLGHFFTSQDRKNRLKNISRKNKIEEEQNHNTTTTELTNTENQQNLMDDMLSVDSKRKRFFRSPKVDRNRY